jgi:hypothetical protein
MEQRELNAFASAGDALGERLRLAIGRDLASIYSDVLHEPPPQHLRELIDKLSATFPDDSPHGGGQP